MLYVVYIFLMYVILVIGWHCADIRHAIIFELAGTYSHAARHVAAISYYAQFARSVEHNGPI